MSENVDQVLAKLRKRLDAETDAELARKLRVGKSTISSWRARGAVPDRYRAILDGASHQMTAVPMQKWSTIETAAFRLALFRHSQAAQSISGKQDYRSIVDYVSSFPKFVLITSRCLKELTEMIDEGEYDVETAFGIIINEDLQNPEGAIKKTFATIEQVLSSRR